MGTKGIVTATLLVASLAASASDPDEYGYHDPNAYFGKVKVVRIK